MRLPFKKSGEITDVKPKAKRKAWRKWFLLFMFAAVSFSIFTYVEHLKETNEKAVAKAEEARTMQEKLAQEKARAEKKARRDAWIARTVQCPECFSRFEPEHHKAPFLGVVTTGIAGGATILGTGGAAFGAGTGIAVGGVGAFPGTVVGGIAGGITGGALGGIYAAWNRDLRLKCPKCGEIFKNPKN